MSARGFLVHPWHGVSAWAKDRVYVNAFIEIVPSDTVKFELDKETGFLMVDRPQIFSSKVPALYGFVPHTMCGKRVGHRATEAVRRLKPGEDIEELVGDGDGVDICVLAASNINQGNIIVRARPIGGLRTIDHGQVDDKLLAVLKDDAVFGQINELADIPRPLVLKMAHYFQTYKQLPTDTVKKVDLLEEYGADEALKVIEDGMTDYTEEFGDPMKSMDRLLNLVFQR